MNIDSITNGIVIELHKTIINSVSKSGASAATELFDSNNSIPCNRNAVIADQISNPFCFFPDAVAAAIRI